MDKVLMKGNEAVAQAAIDAGCRFFFGYPITPQTEISAYMAKQMPKIGGLFLQAESEVSAINMVYGAAGAGARVMTSSSSPGISLKAEGLSYIAASDLPCVIVNIMRAGPGLGGIQASQADYFQATKGAGHGDYHMIVLAPNSVQELTDLTGTAFDIADTYRTPVMIVGDGMLGQMMEPVSFKRGEQKAPIEKPWAATGTKMKRKHNVINSLKIEPYELEALTHEREKKFDIVREKEVRYEEMGALDADLVLVAYGTISRVAQTAMKMAREKGIKVGLIRPITLWPFPKDIFMKAADSAKAFLTIEMSMGQMIDDVRLATECKKPVHFFGRTGGVVPTPKEILSKIEEVWGGLK